MKPLLVILNPRHIPMCVASLEALPTDTCWLRGWTETEIETQAWPVMMRQAGKRGYTHLAVVSDDGRVPLGAWLDVCRIAERGHPVVTGYCNLDMNRAFLTTNQVKSVLPAEPLQTVEMEFYDLRELMEWPEDTFPTSFHGYSLTMMTMEIAREFPFRCYRAEPRDRGHSSDFHHSRRLADAGIDIVGCRDGFLVHCKPTWNAGDDRAAYKPVWLKKRVREIIWREQP